MYYSIIISIRRFCPSKTVPDMSELLQEGKADIHMTNLVVVVVDLLFYVHGKHIRSCRDGQLT